MSGEAIDPYALLGVSRDATDVQIKAAWRARMRTSHPDVGGSHEQSVAIQNAYELLSDPEKRARFDRHHGPSTAASPTKSAESTSSEATIDDATRRLMERLLEDWLRTQRRAADLEEDRRRFNAAYERQMRHRGGSRVCRTCSANRLVSSDRCWAHSSDEQRTASIEQSRPFCCSVTNTNRGCLSFSYGEGLCGTHRTRTAQARPTREERPTDASGTGRGADRPSPSAQAHRWTRRTAHHDPPAQPRPATSVRRRTLALVPVGLAGLVGLLVFWTNLDRAAPFVLQIGDPAELPAETRSCSADEQSPIRYGPDRTEQNWVAETTLDVEPEDAATTLVVELNGRSRSLDLNGEDHVVAATVAPISQQSGATPDGLNVVDATTHDETNVGLTASARNNIGDSVLGLSAEYDSVSRQLSLSVPLEELDPIAEDGFDVRPRVLSGETHNETAACA